MSGEDPTVGSADWAAWRRAVDLDEYEQRWQRIAEAGGNPHGEVDFVMQYAPRTALDAGCGFGRVAVELSARGVTTVGVDLDPDLLERARRIAPDLEWHHADLSTFDLERRFDLVVVAGNVIGFVDAPDRAEAVRRCARHVAPGGRLVIGNQSRSAWPTPDQIDEWCSQDGLEPESRHGGWEREPFLPGAEYIVTVHHRPT
jgi:SAM-dependent methyltransferase